MQKLIDYLSAFLALNFENQVHLDIPSISIGLNLPMTYDPDFEQFRNQQQSIQSEDKIFSEITSQWVKESVRIGYSYGFSWLGVPIIQLPSDLVAFQEIVYSSRPTLIIECGVARGGSAVFWASMQQICGIHPNVIGIDIDIRPHTEKAIKNSIYSSYIQLITGSSIKQETLDRVQELITPNDKVMVVLDSNHTHYHVFEELKKYADLVSVDSYLLVLDTVIDYLPKDPNRPWGPGDNPKTAVEKFMTTRNDFVNDYTIERKIGITVAPKGYWKRIC